MRFEPTRRLFFTLAAGLLLLQVSASPLFAQVITGTVSDARSGVPVGSGFVVLLDRLENEVERVLWSPNGSYRLRAPAPGVYLLRTERIGYRAFVSDPVTVSATGVVNIDLAIISLPIQLATIEVTREDRCRVSPEENAETAVVWEEIRKALAAATWTNSQGLHHTVSNVYERDLGRGGRRIYRESHRPAIAYARSPFVSRSPRLLAAEGYVDVADSGTYYYAPDAVVLQDEQFLQTHCFRLRKQQRDGEDLLGLAFEPAPGRDLPDVEGVLWLDMRTSELRTLEYSYTNLQHDLRAGKPPGGNVEFLRLPGGAWFVHRWQIDFPTSFVEERVSSFDRERRRRVDRYRESGGELLTVRDEDGGMVYQAEVAELTGAVVDSTAGEPIPLVGAIVTIADTWFADTTNQEGRFSLGAPLEGEYGVTFSHPRADSVGLVVPPRPVRLARGRTDTVSLSMPRLGDVVARLCPRSTGGSIGRVLVGTVRDSLTGAPAAGAKVAASWQLIQSVQPLNIRNRESVVTVEEDGSFVLCNLEFGRPVLLYAVTSEKQSRIVRVCFEGGGVEVGGEFYETSRPIWLTDLLLTAASTSTGVLAGTVTNSIMGDPIAGARISVESVDEATETDSRGMFSLSRIPIGRQQLFIEHAGYRTRTGEVDVAADQPTLIGGEFLALSPVAQITGKVTDAVDGTPVAEAWVTLLSDSGTAVAMTRTNELGRYALSASEPGSYRVMGRRLGYSPNRSDLLDLEPGSGIEKNLGLTQNAYTLEPVTVTAEFVSGYLEDVGFFQRRQTSAAGFFLDRDEIARRIDRASEFTDLLYGIPGLIVTRQGVKLRGMPVGTDAPPCSTPLIYVDGLQIHDPRTAEDKAFASSLILNDVIHPNDVGAVELYRRIAELPARFSGVESGCGVMLVWTIHGRT